jgi:hypothetical protein
MRSYDPGGCLIFFPQWAQFADGFDPAPPAWHLIRGRFIRI